MRSRAVSLRIAAAAVAIARDRKFADDFFEKYIEGRELPDYARLFARVGLVLRKRNAGAPWAGVLDRGGFGGRGGRRGGTPAVASAATGVRVPGLVNWGTPAFSAGIEEGDVLVAADDKPVGSLDDWQAALRAHQPGDRMNVEINRHGAAIKTTIVIADDPTMEVVTLESTGASLSADQKAMREAWLASKRK